VSHVRPPELSLVMCQVSGGELCLESGLRRLRLSIRFPGGEILLRVLSLEESFIMFQVS